MKPFQLLFASVLVASVFVAHAADSATAKEGGAVVQPVTADLKPLQGDWEGFMVGDTNHQKITVKITGNALHFHRDTNFWFNTAIVLPAGKSPQQFHATIKECPESQKSSIGDVVVAIFKIEGRTLTVASGNGDGEAPANFETAPNRYEFRKVQPVTTAGTLTDSRDGQTYQTISFKDDLTGASVTWMAQNLNYEVPGSYAYDDKESHRKELGLLYTWEAAKNACPKGWHLATDSEWSMLVTQFGGTEKAGEALKSVSGWTEGGNGSNSSGFNGLPGGIRRNDGYDVLGVMGFWWTSTPSSAEGKAWGWNFSYGGPGEKPLKTKAFRFDSSVSHGKSVRCVQD